jgi:hypothetical protein
VILAIDGREPSSGSHATRILASYQPGEKVMLRIVRMHKTMDVETTLPERPVHKHVATGESHTHRLVPMPPLMPVPQVAPQAGGPERACNMRACTARISPITCPPS